MQDLSAAAGTAGPLTAMLLLAAPETPPEAMTTEAAFAMVLPTAAAAGSVQEAVSLLVPSSLVLPGVGVSTGVEQRLLLCKNLSPPPDSGVEAPSTDTADSLLSRHRAGRSGRGLLERSSLLLLLLVLLLGAGASAAGWAGVYDANATP